MRLRQTGEGFEIGGLDLAAAVEVDHQAAGDLRQMLARLVRFGQPASVQDAQIGVVRQLLSQL
jgi:hypothetical protein